MKTSSHKNMKKLMIGLAGCPRVTEQEISDNLNGLVDFLRQSNRPYLLTDHRSMDFLYAKTDGLFSCNETDLLREGADIAKALIHPDDLARLPKVLKDHFNIFFSFPEDERMGYKYCEEFRFKGKDGRYKWLLHEVTFLKVDAGGKPLLSLSNIVDITHMKQDDTLNLYVGRYEDGINYKVKIAKKYPLFRDKLKLSRKETEILKMISDGLVSKQIADKLNISFHTVNTHRRNMLKKTHSVTSSELVSYAQEFGII